MPVQEIIGQELQGKLTPFREAVPVSIVVIHRSVIVLAEE